MKAGLALRYEVFPPSLLARLATRLDKWGISSIWLNDSQVPIDTLDVCGMILGATKETQVGTGILRIHEYEVSHLAARVHTLNAVSGGRFILGLGTGQGSGKMAIDRLVSLANEVGAAYRGEEHRLPIFFAALRAKMARESFLHADGVLLNFCTPEYVRGLIPRDVERHEGFRIAAYVKLFFSEDGKRAKEMLVREFIRYDSFANYHALFEALGLAKSIEELKGASQIRGPLPDDILEVSLYNPSRKQTRRMLSGLKKAGVDMPVVSLYAEGEPAYRLRTVKALASVAF